MAASTSAVAIPSCHVRRLVPAERSRFFASTSITAAPIQFFMANRRRLSMLSSRRITPKVAFEECYYRKAMFRNLGDGISTTEHLLFLCGASLDMTNVLIMTWGIAWRFIVVLLPGFTSFQVQAKKQTFSSFDDLLLNSDKALLVDFYASWCGPCQFMVPILEQVHEKLKDKIMVVKIDTEKYTRIADRYQIGALPTFIIFRDGKPCDRFEGVLSAEQLIQRIENALKVPQ